MDDKLKSEPLSEDEEAEIEFLGAIADMVQISRKAYKSKDIVYRLSSGVFYASLAEFLTLTLLLHIQQINNDIKKRKFTRTNIGFLLREIDKYDFTLKSKVIPVLKNLKDARNNLFHNLAFEQFKKMNLINELESVNKNTEVLFELWQEITENYVWVKKEK